MPEAQSNFGVCVEEGRKSEVGFAVGGWRLADVEDSTGGLISSLR